MDMENDNEPNAAQNAAMERAADELLVHLKSQLHTLTGPLAVNRLDEDVAVFSVLSATMARHMWNMNENPTPQGLAALLEAMGNTALGFFHRQHAKRRRAAAN